MPVRLGIDASQALASCAVSVGEEIVSSAAMEKPIENFPALIREVIARAGISLHDVDEIVVCIGPGSQMGIRSAVVSGNALALALDKPVSGVLSTDAAAVLLGSEGSYSAAVSAGRRRWFVEEYTWREGKLDRLDTLKLLDDLPEHTEPIFCAAGEEGAKNCACGILVIAEEQRHLISQPMLKEVRPYE